ncbi:MAG TPA: RNA-binding cell elongation regulator Jag/EloR [Bacillales bacterium]|nr:RNA-binding cell elongation regulator Jag/EloR [Bacillales bacterium]
MKEITKSGRTVEEALDAALGELRVDREQVKFQIMEEAKKGFLGIGSKPAVVQVEVKNDPVKVASDFLKEVTEQMGVTVDIEVNREDRNVIFQLSSEKIAILIGKRGNTLNALQYLTNVAANRQADGHVHFILDAENYRERREETLQQLAKRLCKRVRQTGREARLDPMPSMERKVIHVALKDEPGISTYSDGVDPHRRVVIVLDRK